MHALLSTLPISLAGPRWPLILNRRTRPPDCSLSKATCSTAGEALAGVMVGAGSSAD
jgi:hypothetical protein